VKIAVALGAPGSFSSPEEGAPHRTLGDLQGWAADIGVTLEEALAALQAKGPGSDTIRLNMANAFNLAAGFTLYED
jgi:hypothetical protein